ncbi:MAG: caspase family protein [Bacteroidetes bacterium]|nr:caspase family protein [Bacteroidota bacterium]
MTSLRTSGTLLLCVPAILLTMHITAHGQQSIALHLEEGKSGAVWDLTLGPDGKTLYSCGRDSTAKSWDLTTGECIRIFKTDTPTLVTSLALDHTGTWLASGDMNGTLSVWNARSGVRYYSAPAHDRYITDILMTPDGKTIVTAGRDDRIRLWNTDDGRPIRTLEADMLWVHALAVSPDGSLLAAGGQDGKVRLWRLPDGTPEGDLGMHSRFARSLRFSGDGKFLFSSGADGHVLVWDLETRALFRELVLEDGFAHGLDLSRNEELLLVSKMNGLMEIWDWRRRLLKQKLPAPSYGTMQAIFDDAAGRIYSAHTSGAVKIWRIEDGALLLDMVGFSDGQWLSFTPDGYYDCSSFGDRYVQWRKGQELFPLERYSELFKRPAIIEDVLRGGYDPGSSIEQIIDPPTAAILAPRDGQLFAFGSEALEIVVEVEAQDSERIERIAVLLNGRQLSGDQILNQRILARTDTLLRMRFRIPVLPGRNTVEALAVNAARVRSHRCRADITVETGRSLNPSLYVLAVGSDSYAPAFPNLQFATVDAQAIADEFVRQEGGMYTRVYTKTLTDRQATRENIFQALREFPDIDAQDMLLLFFSGHGVRDRDRNGRTRYYYVPAGVTKSTLSTHAMAWDDFSREIRRLKAGRVILLLDACHSGDVSIGASNEKVASSLAGEVGIVFTSSSGNEFSYEDRSWGHGAFTRALLDGLRGKADFTGDRIVDWSELQLYVSTAVRSMTQGSQNPMVPRLEQFANFELVRVP